MNFDEFDDEACGIHPQISSTDLMAAVDGEADATILEHIERCPDCAHRVQRLRTCQHEFRSQFYRLFCPTTDLLADYCQGLLDPQQHARVEHHVACCPLCSSEIALLEQQATPTDRILQGPNVKHVRPLC